MNAKRLAVLLKLYRGELLERDERYTAMNMEDDGLVDTGYVLVGGEGHPSWVLTPAGRAALRNARMGGVL